MLRLHLIHWNAAEAAGRAARLRAAGYAVTDDAPRGVAALRAIRDDPPAAMVIDISRLPSQGRDVGLHLRQWKATRAVPLVFVGGDPEKVAAIRKHLPDAVYTTWPKIRGAVRAAIARPPADPVVPGSIFAPYATTPLVRKLGIQADSVTALLNAPPGVERTLGRLPAGAKLTRRSGGRRDLVLWFVRSRRELARGIGRIAPAVGPGGIWIAWPKRASSARTDLTEDVVRAAGLAAGLVDYKVCSIDATWSGLKFARRKSA